jgi:hypothetical protein
MMRFKGMGLYPDQLNPQGVACYDPNRPSWLPDWIDTSTESACYYASPTLAGQTGAVIGDTVSGVAAGFVGGATGIDTSTIQQYMPYILGAIGLLLIVPALVGHR